MVRVFLASRLLQYGVATQTTEELAVETVLRIEICEIAMTALPLVPATADLTIHRVSARPVLVPLALPLVTAGGAVDKAPLVLVDLETEEGVTGCAYLFTYTPRALAATVRQVEELTPLIAGQRVAPLALAERLAAAFRLLGRPGLVGMALAGLDMAAWDALAKAQGVPLYRLLGAEARRLPAYNSKGLGMIGAPMAAEEARALLAEGFQAVKLRLGYPTRAQDLEVAEAVRTAIGPKPRLFVDFNQTLTLAEARHRVPPLEDFDLEWVEEPLPWDDYRGHGALAAETSLPIQLGRRRFCQGLRGWTGCRLHARCHEDRRGDRLAADRGTRGRPGCAALESSLSGDLQPSARGHADGPLAGVRRLGRTDLGRAVCGDRWRRLAERDAGQRSCLGRGGGQALRSGTLRDSHTCAARETRRYKT